MPNPKKKRTRCPVCGNEPARSFYKYCSNACQLEYQYQDYIRRWKKAEISGLDTLGIVRRQVKRYLREKYGNKCCLCGWGEINKILGKPPLIADHIDGNWKNNTEKNLRLLCPNCDALTDSYAALNKGRGRENRKPSKRAMTARMIAQAKKT